MKFLAGKLRKLYEAIPRRDRIQLKANRTVAVGMAMVDGTPRLVYTVSNNAGSKAFHAAAERLDLHRWTYDSGVKGRGSVGAPNDAEQLMTGFSMDNRAPLRGMVVSRRLCADCATVIPTYGGGTLRVEHIPDTADLPNPRNPPSRLNPPARTVHGEIDTDKPAGSPPGRTVSGPTKPSLQPPPSAVRGAIVPTSMLGANFLSGLLISWYADKMFQRDWAAAMQRVETSLQSELPTYRSKFGPGAQLHAIVQVAIDTGQMNMGPGAGWTQTAAGIKVEMVRVTVYPEPQRKWTENSPRWQMLMGYSNKTTHVRFSFPLPEEVSFPLPEEPDAERVPINAGPRKRTPIRTSRDERRVPIRSGGGTGT